MPTKKPTKKPAKKSAAKSRSAVFEFFRNMPGSYLVHDGKPTACLCAENVHRHFGVLCERGETVRVRVTFEVLTAPEAQ